MAGPVHLLDAALQHSQDVVSKDSHGEAEQRRTGVAKAADLALQRRLKALEHPLHAPTSAVQLRNLPRLDPLGQIAPQPDHALTCLGRRVQGELDAPPWLARPGQLDPLLAHRSGVGAAAGAPGSFCRHLGVATMFADEETGLRRLPAQQDRARAELPIRHPELPRLGAVQQGANRRALALVRVLAGHDVGDQPAVGVVHHQRVSRQRRPAVAAQGRQALLAGRQVVAVEHTQLPARQAGAAAPSRRHRPEPLGAAADQRPQDRRLGATDLVVECAHRHRQGLQGPRCRVQGRAQTEGDQRHRLDHRGEQQLTRVLPLAVFLEHRVDPLARKGMLQRNPRHHTRRCLLLKALEDRGPDGHAPVPTCNPRLKMEPPQHLERGGSQAQ